MKILNSITKILTLIKVKASKTSANIQNAALRVEAKAKGTMFEKWVISWKTMYLDYKDLLLDIKHDVREEPIKAVCWASLLAALSFCAKHNPNMISYRGSFIGCANELLLVHPSLQKVEAATTINKIRTYFAKDLVRRLNLGIASIIWVDYHNRSCKNSESTCAYLQMYFYEFQHHIIDVGFFDKWWFLSSCMENYDINY
ncbi:hypothetical protein RI129_008246 [Pyrocoelia pectoralis]|uniref:Uncharacterized protein n=1 Tax=Pyrocoelia pectoralis TaxID=417401 RepID=A0AAN7VEU8_9COLE